MRYMLGVNILAVAGALAFGGPMVRAEEYSCQDEQQCVWEGSCYGEFYRWASYCTIECMSSGGGGMMVVVGEGYCDDVLD